MQFTTVVANNLIFPLTVVPSSLSLFLACHPQMIFGLSWFFFPFRADVKTVLKFELVTLWTTWYMVHFQRLPWIVLASGIVRVLHLKSVQCIFRIIQRHFRRNKFSSLFIFGGVSECNLFSMFTFRTSTCIS